MSQPLVTRRADLTPDEDMPRVAVGARTTTAGITVGEWALTRAAWTDRHAHVEVNTVLEGELVVHCDGTRTTLGPGDTIVVPGGALARYEAPVHARMTYVYGPGPEGMTDTAYEEL